MKNYYTRFAAGGPAACSRRSASVHGPGGPQTAPAAPVAPVVAAAPTASAPRPGFAPLVPVPGAPTITGQADDASAPVAPDRLALRLGGTNTTGPGAGPDTTLPPIPAPHQLYQTGLPGVTISGPPGSPLAPPSASAPVTTGKPLPARRVLVFLNYRRRCRVRSRRSRRYRAAFSAV